MNKLAEQIIVDILNFEMVMPDNSVWIRNQNKQFPKDDGLYIIVGMVSSQPFTVTNTVTPTDTGMQETQKIISRDDIQIDIVSRSNSAILRRYELLAALQSVYSKQMQASNSFKIFKMPTSFNDTSSAEGGSRLNRYTLTIPCHVWYTKTKALESPNGDYYNIFRARVDDAVSIAQDEGIVEFTITEDIV